ncbi:response regulator transcription factor [Methylophilus sp. OH31]|uniref:response regulator transcription factor n=1 Tax=Methylophilus sp. OH31 TaxID=1387312 RepID=UPI0009DF0A1C|nr:response regulator transcription factor [Methylophilus sp. OH31]
MNIIVVEDHDILREVTVSTLRNKGHQVIGLESAEALPEQKQVGSIDIMLIDVNLPGESGLTLTQRLRHIYPDIGIIMISANQLPSHKMQGYDSGADLYLTKPASLDEINAAIQALSRRLKRTSAVIASTTISLHLQGMVLKHGNTAVKVSQQETILLHALLRAPDQRLETWQLLDLLSHEHLEYSKASLEVTIVRLRKKLMFPVINTENPIRSIRNYGYQLCIKMTALD